MDGKRKRWTDDLVLASIRARYKAGKSLQHNVVRREDLALLGVTYVRFGSWANAVLKAGLPYQRRPYRHRKAAAAGSRRTV